jgi:hypothetical protein
VAPVPVLARNAVRDLDRDGSGRRGQRAGRGHVRGAGCRPRNRYCSCGRNPNASDKLFTPMILVLALIESLAIYALVIAIMLLGKVP